MEKENYLEAHSQVTGDFCEDLIESFQVSIVRAGGAFINRTKLESMTLKGLNEMSVQNSIISMHIPIKPATAVPAKTKAKRK